MRFFGKGLFILHCSNLAKKIIDYRMSQYLTHYDNIFIKKYVQHYDYLLNSPVISIQGTKYYYDWIENLNCSLIKCDKVGNVHSGYYESAREIYNNIQTKDSHLHKKNIYITGFSSGAAKAILLAYFMSINNTKSTFHITTFGMPTFSDQLFTTSILNIENICITSYTFRDDIVPKIGIGVKFPSFTLTPPYNCSGCYECHNMIRYKDALQRNLFKARISFGNKFETDW